MHEKDKKNMDEKVYYKLRQGVITDCDSSLYYKLRQRFIRNCDRYVITNCDKFYYKLRQILQIATTVIKIAIGSTNCDVITNCDSTHITVKVVATGSAVAALLVAIAVTLMYMCTSLSQHCSLPLLSQCCARFRCQRAVLVFAVTELCTSVSDRCGISPVYS